MRFKNLFKLLFSSILILVFYCCQSRAKSPKISSSKTVEYAQFFRIIKHSDFTEIQIINPDNNKIVKKLALGKRVLELSLTKDLIPIKTPISSIITLNGTDIGMLSKINCIKYIKGIASVNYIHNSELKEYVKQGIVGQYSDLNKLDPEKIFNQASIISYSSFGTPPVNEAKLQQLGVNCIPMFDWRESHPLGKAEWLKVLACLFDKEKEAEKYLKEINSSFKTLVKTAKKTTYSPRILSGSMIGDSWYMPAGQSFNAYLFLKAHCNYVAKNKKGTGSVAFTFENVYRNYRDADIWINPMLGSKKELLGANPKYAYFKAFQNKQVYCYSHNMNYFWENSAIEPQKVLSDLIQIFHANEVKQKLIPKKKLYFYRKIRE